MQNAKPQERKTRQEWNHGETQKNKHEDEARQETKGNKHRKTRTKTKQEAKQRECKPWPSIQQVKKTNKPPSKQLNRIGNKTK